MFWVRLLNSANFSRQLLLQPGQRQNNNRTNIAYFKEIHPQPHEKLAFMIQK